MLALCSERLMVKKRSLQQTTEAKYDGSRIRSRTGQGGPVEPPLWHVHA
jgi:hypothetical protein